MFIASWNCKYSDLCSAELNMPKGCPAFSYTWYSRDYTLSWNWQGKRIKKFHRAYLATAILNCDLISFDNNILDWELPSDTLKEHNSIHAAIMAISLRINLWSWLNILPLKALVHDTRNYKHFFKKNCWEIVAHIYKTVKKSLQLWKKVAVCMKDTAFL